jgi:hypothetical protein
MSNAEFFLTARLIVVAGAGCFAIGLAVMLFGASRLTVRPEPRDMWFYAPLVVPLPLFILICPKLALSGCDVLAVGGSGSLLTAAALGGGFVLAIEAGDARSAAVAGAHLGRPSICSTE